MRVELRYFVVLSDGFGRKRCLAPSRI